VCYFEEAGRWMAVSLMLSIDAFGAYHY